MFIKFYCYNECEEDFNFGFIHRGDCTMSLNYKVLDGC